MNFSMFLDELRFDEIETEFDKAIKGTEAEELAKKHAMKSMDCLRIAGGFNSIEEMFDSVKKDGP